MDFHFQGFDPVLSPYLLIIAAACFLLAAWWSYSYLTSIPDLSRWILTLLRAGSLLVLFILLLNPYLEWESLEQQMPQVAVYLDDSQSMAIHRGEYSGLEAYRSNVEELMHAWPERAVMEIFTFSDAVRPAGHPDLELDGTVTDLEQVISHLRQQPEETVAAVIFSDGIITRGRDPLFTARELQVPLFTIPMGDTSSVKDLAISEVLVGETGYVNARQAVSVVVTGQGYPQESSVLRLRREGVEIDQRPVYFESERSTVREEFEIEFEEEGVRHFEVHIDELEGELTDENNTYPFSIHVLDEKTVIYHLAFEIHPDVSMLRSILERDPQLELHPFTWLGDRFLETPGRPAIPDEAELLILHGLPPTSSEIADIFPDAISTIQFLTPGTAVQSAGDWIIPLSITGSPATLPVQPERFESGGSHPITDFEQPNFDRFPLLSAGIFSEAGISPLARVLYGARHEGESTGAPLVIIEESGDIRRSLVMAYGWYLYRQSSEEFVRDFSEQLLVNLVYWTATPPDHRHLDISPGRQVYQQGEEIYFRASLISEATGEPETGAVLDLTVVDPEGNEQNYSMLHHGEGNYRVLIPNLPPGDYRYEAEARRSDRLLESATGEFSITASSVELLDTRRNDLLMENLSRVTGGVMIEPFDTDLLLSEMESRSLFEYREEMRTELRYLHSQLFWFLVVLLLLTTEWIIRRRHSLP